RRFSFSVPLPHGELRAEKSKAAEGGRRLLVLAQCDVTSRGSRTVLGGGATLSRAVSPASFARVVRAGLHGPHFRPVSAPAFSARSNWVPRTDRKTGYRTGRRILT